MNGTPSLCERSRAGGGQRGWRGDVLAVVAGRLLPLAFAPFNLLPLAGLSPAILCLLWLFATPRLAFRRGFGYGLGLFGRGVSWVFVSMYDYGGVSLGLSLVLTSLFVAFLALFPGMLGYLVVRLFPQDSESARRIKLLSIFPVAWVLAECVRGWFLTGFPWLNLGYSQLDAPLAGFAPLLGVYGVSLSAALSAGALAVVVRGPGRWRIGAATGEAQVWGCAFALHAVNWLQTSGEQIRLSLLQ